jgi:hypothetical protein
VKVKNGRQQSTHAQEAKSFGENKPIDWVEGNQPTELISAAQGQLSRSDGSGNINGCFAGD